MSKQTEALKLAQKAMGLIGADLVCEAAHHEKKDRHQIGEPCPIQARWHQAFAAIREALAEQPAPMIRGDIRDGLVDDEPAQSSKPFDTHAAPGQSFDTHSRTPQQKLVPYEPSIDMQEQGSIASGYDLSQARAKKVYQAMIDMHDVMMEREPTDDWFRLQAGYPEQPAQRKPWVGLTDVEIASACKKHGGAEWWWRDIEEYGRAIEAKLKEKNA